MLERFLDEFGRKTTREKFLWGRRAALILAAAQAGVPLLEHPGKILRADSDPRIRDRQRMISGGSGGDRNRSAGRGIFNGVADDLL